MKTKFKKIRKSKGFSARRLAELSGVSIQTIQFYDQNILNINNAKINTLAKLVHVLECDITDVLEDENLIKMLKK